MANTDENETTVDSKKEDWFTAPIVVAICPILAYLFTFRFEEVFCSIYKIPTELISINLSTLFKVSLAVLVFIILFDYFDRYIGRRVLNFFYRLVYMLIMPLIPILLSDLKNDPIRFDYRYYLGIFLILLIINIIIEFRLRKTKNRLTDHLKNLDDISEKCKMQECVNKECRVSKDINETKHMIKYGYPIPRWRYIIPCLLIAYFYAFPCGIVSASLQYKYYFIQGKDKTAILRIYNDNIIATHLDKNNKPSKKLIVLKISDISNDKIQYVNIGRLKMKRKFSYF